MKLADRLIARITSRPPDVVIGGQERPYLRRWWVIPRNRFFNVYLHEFRRSDDDRAHHTHPWLFNASVLLRGSYVEHTIERGGLVVKTRRDAGAVKVRLGAAPHRIELHNPLAITDGGETIRLADVFVPCWTLFITGPVVRHWGFLCGERGFVHWRDFTAADDPGAVGKGCEA